MSDGVTTPDLSPAALRTLAERLDLYSLRDDEEVALDDRDDAVRALRALADEREALRADLAALAPLARVGLGLIDRADATLRGGEWPAPNPRPVTENTVIDIAARHRTIANSATEEGMIADTPATTRARAILQRLATEGT